MRGNRDFGPYADKEFEVFSATEDPQTAISSLIRQYYLSRGYAPGFVLLPFDIDDRELLEVLFEKEFSKEGIKIIYFPYTRGISSTKITEALQAVRKNNLEDLK